MIHRILATLGSRAVTAVLSLVLIFLAVRMALTQAALVQVEGRIAALKQRGVVTEPVKLNPPKIPIRENSAPLYQAAIELVSNYPYQSAERSQASETEENFVRLLQGTEAPELQEALRLLELASQRPGCAFNRNYELGFSMPSPNFIGIRALCRLALADAKLSQQAGKTDLAARRLTQLSLFLRRGDLNKTLMGHAILLSCVREMTENLQSFQLHDPGLRAELSLLEADVEKGFTQSIQGERACGIDCFGKIQNDHHLISVMNDPNGKVSLLEWIFGVTGNSLILLDELNYLELMQQAEDAAQSGRAAAPLKPGLPYWMSSWIVPNFNKIHQRHQEVQEKLHQTIDRL